MCENKCLMLNSNSYITILDKFNSVQANYS